MVFESLVVDLMNKYLGKYIENLDSSQLKLGIWGGDAVLQNLHVKGDALKDLNLPVEIKSGHIGKLTLKIPWKNLYKEAVEATLDGLFLLAVPNVSMEYDPEKEAKKEQDNKQAQISAIEAQQLAKKKGKEEKQDGFVEKLATQIIKNLQIRISNIHIRYEDKVTMKQQPFALGITLDRLNFETTNENWMPCLLDESVKIIFKMVDLQCLSVYWNSEPKTFISDSSRDKQLNIFRSTIASQSFVPPNFTYIIKPITLQAKLRLNPHPESDLATPKIVLTLLLQEVGLRLLHQQYHSIMELVESMDRMVVNAPFRKFKPNVRLSGNTSLWWKYAFNSVTSIGIISNAKNWSWSHIREHRKKIREYKALYKEKLQEKKPSQSLTDKLIAMENGLDIFNITLARQTAELELTKAGRQIRSKKSVHQPDDEKSKEGGGWFSGWFGKKKKPDEEKEVAEQGLDSVMSSEEKDNLYLAIGYSEGEVIDNSAFPKSYIGTKLNIDLQKVSVELSDSSVSDKDLLSLRLLDVHTVLDQRPSAQGLGVTAHMSSFEVDGIAQGDFVPCLISSQLVPSTDQGTAKHLLSVLFEKRPLDETCDQRILVDSQPLQIVYDAATINHLMEFFKPPRDMQLQQLRSVAASAYDDIKEQTATGLQHVMETRNVVEIGIFFSSSYVVVPSNGCFQNEVDALVLDLGEISFQSSNHDRTPLMKRTKVSEYAWVQQLKTDDTLDLQEMRSKAYENYKIEVRKIQLLFARRGEDWMSARKLNKSKLHILTPLDISVLLQKCMVTNDAALPKIKISGEIPLLGLRISDVKLQEMLKLIKSIPLPEPITPNDQAAMMALDAWTKDTRNKDLKVLNSALTGQFKGSMSSVSSGRTSSADDEFFTAESDFGSDMDDDKAAKRKKLVRSSSKEKQMTDLSLNFSINEMVLRVTEELNKDSGVDLVLLNVGTLAVDLNVRTWDTSVGVSLDFVAISLLQFKEPDGSPLYLINSAATGGSKHLLNVNILQVQRRSPDFVDLHNRTELKILISFGILKVGLHAQAMLELASFAKKLAVLQTEKPEKPAITSEDSFKTAHSVHSPKVQSTVAVKTTTATTESKPTSASAGKNEGPPVINVHLEAKLECINVTVMDQTQLITKLKIEGVETMVLMTLASQKVLAKLHNFEVCDTSAETLYTTIVSAVGQDVLQAEFINYIDATKAPGALADMDVVDTSVHLKLGCLRVVFLNKFVQKLIAYGAYFKDAKQAAIDAGTAAQQQASAKARELASSNPRIKLDVTVYAPKVVVPMHSMSRDAITADLGTLTVTNRFLASDQQHENSPAVRDEMMVKLQDMKLQTCKIGENMKSTDEAPIMEDLILVIEIVRNLSVSWYNDVPDVSISGHMPPILLKLSQQDMISVMTMLDKNLKEGKIDEIESVVEATVQATIAPAYGTAVEKEPAIPAKAEIEKVWETLKVSFGLESVILQLYSDAQRKEPLSKLEFARIKADVVMRSDKLVNVEVSLGELALHDTRKGHAGGITRFIQNRTQENGTNVVQAKIVQLSDGSLEVEAMVRSLNIIICMEFIMGLANFFMKSLPEKTSPEPVPKKEIESSVPSKGARVSKVDHPKIPANRAVPDKKSEGSKAIRVTFFLEEPEIVLVTDVRSVESEAIVLGLKLDFKFDVTPDGKQQLMSAALSDLHVVGCSFKNVLNKATPSPFTHKQILAPCDISFAGLVGELEQKFNVTLSDLRLKASPVIIHTISDIVDHLTLPPKKDVEQEEAGKRLSGYQALSIWTSQKVDEMKLWFMKENSSSVDDLEEAENKLDGALKMETANLSMPLLQIQLEAGSGHHTIPLLITECTVEGEIKNWSSGEMSGEVELTLGTAYFNDTLSVWEPLIEPVEVDAAAIEPKYEPWKVTTSIQQRKPSKDDSPELAALMTVSVESQNVLQTTITNSAIKVINGLARAFKDAALSRRNENRKKKKKKHAGVEEVDGEVQKRANAAIVVKNHLGFDITVDVGKALTVIEERKKIGNGSSTYSLPNKDHLMLDYCVKEKADLWSVLLDQEKMLTNDSVRITVRLDSSTTASIDISHTGAALHVISTKDGTTLPFVANVMSKPGIRKIELRSHVVFYNHLNVNVEVHSNSDKADIISTIQAKDHLAIPVKTARDHAVKIKPLIEKGNLKSALVSWKNSMDSDKINKFHVQCLPVAGVASPTYISVQVEVEKLIDGAQFDEPGLGIHLRPTAVFQNYLPFPIELEVGGVSVKGHCIDMGQQIQVLDAEMGKSEINIKILSYQNINWISSLTLASNLQELSPWTFNDAKDKNVTITLAKQITYAGGVMTVTLYSPYWMVNKTGFPLDYKSSDDDPSKAVQQAEKDQDVILFSFTSKSFLSKNKLQTRVCNSSFSESFSIDTVGSSGAITCKTKEFNYIIGTNITLTSFSLTKMVTFTSYYSFHNKSGLDVEISESAAQPSNWLSVPSGGKINFWPECKDKFLVVRIKGFDNSVSTKFRYNLLDSGVLVRVGDYALFAEVACTEASIDISIRNYFNGASALLVINDTSSSSVTCWQAKTEAKMQIEAGEAHHVLWDNPTTKREIIWQSSTGKEMTMDVFNEQASFFAVSGQTKATPITRTIRSHFPNRKVKTKRVCCIHATVSDEVVDSSSSKSAKEIKSSDTLSNGDITATAVSNIRHKLTTSKASSNYKIHYVLFVDGLQRTLLFTENEERAQLVEASLRLERANFELNLSLKGISCSLTDSKARREVAYLAIRSSGLVWEEQPRKRWKPLAQKYSQMLEVAYQKQLGGSTHKEHLTLDKYSFDLNTMTVLKPDKCPLQRSFSPGVWFQFTLTPHQMMVHAKINRLQLDSQLPGAVFPVVLNPIPLPKSIAIDSTPKPFIEMSVMQRTSDQQTFTHIKYFRILVQEFSIKLDMGFINALLPVFGAQEVKTTPEQMLQYFQDDLSQTVQTISDEAMENLKAAVNFYDNLHLSPIKVHVSFSMQNTLGDDSQSNGNVVALPFNALSVVLRSVGVTLSDIDDIVFKLAYFERKYQFFTSKEFSKAVTVHYAGQAIKQLYVLVLGLDVIGNPYGLVMGIADGVTSLFYEPYQGMIQGPGEFIQGLGLGALNLFSSTVGGAAGAVSKVTGALGKGIATMTMDDDYKRKRMEQKNKQPANAQEGLARGGKGLVMGVLSGVTGIVTKPIEGAKKEGATGFFKGVGKGLIGVVARPVSGVIDLASSTFEGIQKVADMSEEVRKIRPARWIDSHTGIIQPFSLRRAQGAAILGEVENGRYSKTARYLDHIPLKKDKKSVLLVTNKMVMSVHTGDILGQWKCDWKCNFTDFTEKPQILKDAINFSFKEQPLTWGRVAGDSTQAPQTPAQQIENVFKPLSRAFSFGRQPSGDIASGLKGLFSSGSRKSLFSRSNTIATSSVQYSKGGTNVHLNESTESQPQAKTKSIFGMKNTHHSVIFHDLSYAEYIMKIILARWQRSLKGTSVSSVDSASTSSEER